MAWKPGDDCTASTTRRRPWDVWRSFSRFRTHRVVSELRIWRAALEDWLSKKRQYEMFTDRNGRPCQASDDSLVAAMFRLMPKSLEETVMFTNEDEGFQELFDRLLAYSSTKQSFQMSESKRPTRKDDPMDVDALSKGSGKGKLKGKGKKGKDQNHMSVKCWNCGKSGHYGCDCREMWW